MRRKLTILAIIVGSAACSCQQVETAAPPFQGNLPQALLFVDRTFHVSVLGEIVEPVPSHITLRIDVKATAATTLASIAAQCPGYMWRMTGSSFIIAQTQLYRDSANPMNQVLPHYEIPGDLDTFRLSFPSAVSAAAEHVSGTGGLLNGLSVPDHGPPISLQREQLQDQTARQILLRIADQVHNLYSILILPSPHPIKQERENATFLAWDIVGGPEVSKYAPRVSSYSNGSR
jgi:hypothetical protein